MKIIERYIARNVLSSIALMSVMLAALNLFMGFVGELNSIGTGDYTVFSALFYVLMQLPYQIYLMLPIACLLGALWGLGQMANKNELVVCRAHGVSILQIIGLVIKIALFTVLLIGSLGETLVPKLVHYAENEKALDKSRGQTLRTAQGLWLRTKQDFIHIDYAKHARDLEGIYQFRFNDKKQLILARHIKQAIYQSNQWHAFGIRETVFYKDRTMKKRVPAMLWLIDLPPKMIATSVKAPQEMGLVELWRYIRMQDKAYLATEGFEMNFWRRVLQPATIAVMMLLAVPFIFGSLRSKPLGQRLLFGAMAGFGFYMMNDFALPISQIYQLPPLLTQSLPTIVFSIVGVVMLLRRRV